MSDDFYSLGGNSTDDYLGWQNHEILYFDDDVYAGSSSSTSSSSGSSSHARQGSGTSWIDKWFNNSTSNDLNPVEDVQPDNVLASLIFNSIVCILLLGLYELLRRLIPSVYSQRLMYNYMGLSAATTDGYVTEPSVEIKRMPRGNGTNGHGQEETDESKIQTTSNEGEQPNQDDVVVSSDSGSSSRSQASAKRGGKRDARAKRKRGNLPNNLLQQESYSFTICSRSISLPVLEWCIPVHATPWSTLRHLAGLDAYFYLRYIRMCLKITAVSSFWAIIILFPTYATGGGAQSGFYHFSMANVLQNDKARVWIPTFFCWAFTMYCWFCIRAEMMHYLELRMEFLGGEEEEWIFQRMNEWRNGGGGEEQGEGGRGSYGPPEESLNPSKNNHDSCEQGESEIDTQRSRSRSPLLDVSFKDIKALSLERKQHDLYPPSSSPSSQRQMNQHRYSLQIEKVPVALRSNTALYNYFNEIFPNQVHSACLAMNVPDLDALSSRRMRVCRRLEKSLAYYSVTGIRPTHVAGRPRFQCCGIESTPIDGWCILCCCFIDSCNADLHSVSEEEDHSSNYRTEVYDSMPDKGETVDSILYYTYDLASCNLRLKKMQEEKFLIAETGNSPRNGGIGDDRVDHLNADWLGMLKSTSARAVEGLRDEFEVSGEEDYFGDGVTGGTGGDYGSITSVRTFGNTSPFSSTTTSTYRRSGQEKTAPLIIGDHLTESDRLPVGGNKYIDAAPTRVQKRDDTTTFTAFGRKSRYQSRPLIWLRALLWRLGVDFLAAGLDEVRNRTDVVVDNVTRPSMSSTGFVTFKTLTPVTVTTSAPLTYKRNPMEVSVAPEPRDLVWQNVQIDRDIIASREFVANVLLGFGVLFWSIPLTLIQAWAKVETVALIPGFEWVGEIAVGAWKPFVNDYLPVITLLGLILLLPVLFTWIATSYEKRKTISGVQNSIVGRYFYYQLANIYITVTAGALWTALGNIINNPKQLLVILGETMPKLAGYFISLLLTKTFAGLPLVLLRIGALSRMIFLRSCFNKKRLTQRELKEVYRRQPINYGWEYPTQFLVIIICFTYACISPLVLPVGSLYFFVALLVYKKQALYVYSPTYESGGRMFPQAVTKTLSALLISQMTFIGYTLIRKGLYQIFFLSPLPFLTVFFTIHIQRRYVEPSKTLSLERAVKIDALLDQTPEFSYRAYQQPVLSEPASVPVCETTDDALREVIENLNRLQNQESFMHPQSQSLVTNNPSLIV